MDTHTPGVAVRENEVEATCAAEGFYDEVVYCKVCEAEISRTEKTIPVRDHFVTRMSYKAPTYTQPGWEAYEYCLRCNYSTYVEIPALGEPSITTYDEFIENLAYLEIIADEYALAHPTEDPLNLIIKYIRTGVERYNSDSWDVMAGEENEEFTAFVQQVEDMFNAEITDVNEYYKFTGLRNLEEFELPADYNTGKKSDMGHIFGTMDISYYNKGSVNHADVSGWGGDLTDLLSSAYRVFTGSEEALIHLTPADDLEDLIDQLEKSIFRYAPCEGDNFSQSDFEGDMDGMYLVDRLQELGDEYEPDQAMMTQIFSSYFTEELTNENRADYFLKERLGTSGTRDEIREAVYQAYTGNIVISTLEGTRDFGAMSASKLAQLRKACCYVFADYVCKLAGDYVEEVDNPWFTDFEVQVSQLAPGITQEIHKAMSKDGEQMVYYDKSIVSAR